MKFTTFFTQIMLLNTMGALGIRHVINIMGYVRDIPDGSFRVRSTNGLRVTPPISMKFGTLADNA